MTTSGTAIPFTFVDLDGTFGAPPFAITPHPGFADLTPVFVVKNLNPVPTAPDDFISIGSVAGAPPDPWTVEFRWATVGPFTAGAWQLDAWLDIVGPPPFAGTVPLPGLPFTLAQTEPSVNAKAFAMGAIAFAPPPPPGVFVLAQIHATLRWNVTGVVPIVRVAGRAEGPVITFYQPE